MVPVRRRIQIDWVKYLWEPRCHIQRGKVGYPIGVCHTLFCMPYNETNPTKHVLYQWMHSFFHLIWHSYYKRIWLTLLNFIILSASRTGYRICTLFRRTMEFLSVENSFRPSRVKKSIKKKVFYELFTKKNFGDERKNRSLINLVRPLTLDWKSFFFKKILYELNYLQKKVRDETKNRSLIMLVHYLKTRQKIFFTSLKKYISRDFCQLKYHFDHLE